MVMDGGKGKKLKKCCVVEDIEHQRGEIENDGIRENEGDSSPMFKTRPKQDIVEKWGDLYNMSKTIVKKGVEGSLGYCANGPIGISSPMSKTRPKQIIEEKWGD